MAQLYTQRLRRLLRRATRRHADPIDFDTLPTGPETIAVPDEDFITTSFDSDHGVAPNTMVVIVSNERSGSTFLCDLIYRCGFCLPHEYFQPYQYMPILARRWSFIRDGKISWPDYVGALERYRTSAAGVLGINIHAKHIPYFSRAVPHFTARDRRFHLLIRRNVSAQAMSFDIASKTNQWSQHFVSTVNYEYSFDNALQALNKIQFRNAVARAYLEGLDCGYTELYYEDIVADPAGFLTQMTGWPRERIESCLNATAHAALPKQNTTSSALTMRFNRDLLEYAKTLKAYRFES